MVSAGIVLGLSSAIAFGLLDSLISIASRFFGTMQTIVVAQAISAVLILLYLVSFLKTGLVYQPSTLPLLLLVGISLGIVNTCANLSLYRGLAIGPVALVSPIAASYGLVTTILALCIYHDALGMLQVLAIGLVFAGVVLAATDSKRAVLPRFSVITWMRICLLASALVVSTLTCIVLLLLLPGLRTAGWIVIVPGLIGATCLYFTMTHVFLPSEHRHFPLSWRKPNMRAQFIAPSQGILFGLGAMLCFGIEFFILSAATRELGPTQPIMWSRTFSVILLLCYAGRKRTNIWRGLSLKHLGIIALIALFDTLGMVWYDIGTGQSATSIVATLSSTYMLIPTLLGIIIYRERLKRLQWVGVGSIIMGVVLLALSG
jgi:drug/metabolite transporter (DMT)-like permease